MQLKIILISVICLAFTMLSWGPGATPAFASQDSAKRCNELLTADVLWSELVNQNVLIDSASAMAAIQGKGHIAFRVSLRHGGDKELAIRDLQQLITARGPAAVWVESTDIGQFIIVEKIDFQSSSAVVLSGVGTKAISLGELATIIHRDLLEVIQIGPRIITESKFRRFLNQTKHFFVERLYERPKNAIVREIKLHELHSRGQILEGKLAVTRNRLESYDYIDSLGYPELRYQEDVAMQNEIANEISSNYGRDARRDGQLLVDSVFRGDIQIEQESPDVQDLFKLAYLYRIFEWRRAESQALGERLRLAVVRASIRRTRLELAIIDKQLEIREMAPREIQATPEILSETRISLTNELVTLQQQLELLTVQRSSTAIKNAEARAHLERVSMHSTIAAHLFSNFQNPLFYLNEKVAKKLGDLDRDYRREIDDIKLFAQMAQ